MMAVPIQTDQWPVTSDEGELMREFTCMLESLVVATEHEDRARMSFAFERLKDRYLDALRNVRIGTIGAGQ